MEMVMKGMTRKEKGSTKGKEERETECKGKTKERKGTNMGVKKM